MKSAYSRFKLIQIDLLYGLGCGYTHKTITMKNFKINIRAYRDNIISSAINHIGYHINLESIMLAITMVFFFFAHPLLAHATLQPGVVITSKSGGRNYYIISERSDCHNY